MADTIEYIDGYKVTTTATGTVIRELDRPPLEENYGTKITKLAFRNRFTTAEKVILELAAIDNPAASTAARQQASTLRVAQADQRDASHIDLARAETIAGVQMLEAAGLIAAGRASVILDTLVTEAEQFK